MQKEAIENAEVEHFKLSAEDFDALLAKYVKDTRSWIARTREEFGLEKSS